jgi:hypothetical protein
MTAVALPKSRIPVAPLASDTIITDDLWHRIGLVWGGASLNLYVDGTLVAADEEGSLVHCSGGLIIGRPGRWRGCQLSTHDARLAFSWDE